MLVLSLFPGADLLGMAFELEGFCVVQGPDVQFGRDIRDFHPPAGRFDGVIGGPPCQAFSRLQRLLEHQRKRGATYKLADNLIPEFARVVSEASPLWYVMENVTDAPHPSVPGYDEQPRVVNNRWCRVDEQALLGPEQNRLRRFVFGHKIVGDSSPAPLFDTAKDHALFESPVYKQAVTASTGGRHPRYSGSGKLKKRFEGGELYKYESVADMLRAQGLREDLLDDAPFTAAGKRKLIGNGVPLPMGRAVARAVKRALGIELEAA